MAQLQQSTKEEETSAGYRSEQVNRSEDTRSAISKADTMTAEERQRINQPGRAAFGEALTGEIPASARHVRLEELAEALSAIEARKGEAVVGTNPLGMALLQTNAGVDAETVWEEIQKQREQQRKAGATRKQNRRKHPPVWLQIGVGIACVGATFAAVRVIMGDIRVVQENSPQAPTVSQEINQAMKRTQNPPNWKYEPLYIEQSGMVSLANLPEGKAFYLDPHKAQQLNTILQGDQNTLPVPREELKEYYISPGKDNDSWNAVLLDGKVYIRAWTNLPPGTKKGDLLNTDIRFYNRPDGSMSDYPNNFTTNLRGNPPVSIQYLRPITVPVEAFGGISSASSNGFSTMMTQLKYLDNAAWGNWQPLPMAPGPDGMSGYFRNAPPLSA